MGIIGALLHIGAVLNKNLIIHGQFTKGHVARKFIIGGDLSCILWPEVAHKEAESRIMAKITR